MDDEQRRLDDPEDEDDDGTRGIWAAFERDGGGRPIEQVDVNVDTMKERLKRAARLRASQPTEEPG